MVLSLVSEMLKAIAEYAKHDRAEFVRVVQEAQSSQQTAEVRKQRTRLATAKQRVSELEVLLCKIYEDNILGKLSDSRYATLDAQYEKEQSELTAEISALEKAIKSYEKHEKDADRFIALIDKYENFDKLTIAMLNEFIEKILVHEAIVDRDIYNAAQKMLTVTKYAKKGFPFPNLKVVDGGALKGFVSVNRSWTGFTVEDYKKASQSVYSDQNSIQDIEESKEEKKDGGFDLSGYEIVRAQFFSTRLNPAMTISEGRITFNTACLKKFEDVEYVEILFNSIERCIAVRPCDKDNINAVKWGTIRNGKWAVLPKSCRGFSEPLFELMDWNNECKYRFRGQYSKEDNEQILLFDLEEPEVIKHEIIQEDLPDTDTTETEENTVDTSKNKTKKIVRTLFPKQWQNHFGDSSEDVLLLHRVKYYGNWDVLRPAKIVEGLEPMYIFDLLETEIFMDTKRKKKANPDSLEKKEELVTAETDQTPEQNQEEIAAKVARKLNRIPFYPKDWKDSFGLSVEEHKKALETNLTDGYIEFSATR